MNSLQWIKNYSNTSKIHPGNTTILSWIHNKLEQDSYLTSANIHYQYKLQKEVQHVQAMVFNIKNEIVMSFEVYRLTFDGFRQISKCDKNSDVYHAECEKSIFYEEAPYRFETMSLKVSDFI